MSLAAAACGADGLLVEVHENPVDASSDGAQSLYPAPVRSTDGALAPVARSRRAGARMSAMPSSATRHGAGAHAAACRRRSTCSRSMRQLSDGGRRRDTLLLETLGRPEHHPRPGGGPHRMPRRRRRARRAVGRRRQRPRRARRAISPSASSSSAPDRLRAPLSSDPQRRRCRGTAARPLAVRRAARDHHGHRAAKSPEEPMTLCLRRHRRLRPCRSVRGPAANRRRTRSIFRTSSSGSRNPLIVAEPGCTPRAVCTVVRRRTTTEPTSAPILGASSGSAISSHRCGRTSRPVKPHPAPAGRIVASISTTKPLPPRSRG